MKKKKKNCHRRSINNFFDIFKLLFSFILFTALYVNVFRLAIYGIFICVFCLFCWKITSVSMQFDTLAILSKIPKSPKSHWMERSIRYFDSNFTKIFPKTLFHRIATKIDFIRHSEIWSTVRSISLKIFHVCRLLNCLLNITFITSKIGKTFVFVFISCWNIFLVIFFLIPCEFSNIWSFQCNFLWVRYRCRPIVFV